METTITPDQTRRPNLAEAQAVARDFLACALPDVERVDVTKIAPVSSGGATWEAEAEVWQPNPTLKSLGLETGRPVSGPQPLLDSARRHAERTGIRTGSGHVMPK